MLLSTSAIRHRIFSFQNNPKNLDPSYKTDLDLWDCLGRLKWIIAQIHRTGIVTCSHSTEDNTPSYSRINTVYPVMCSKEADGMTYCVGPDQTALTDLSNPILRIFIV